MRTLEAINDLPKPAVNPLTEAAWEKAQNAIVALVRLEDGWDGEGAKRVPPELIRSATDLARQLRDNNNQPPTSVYPLPDGNIMLEWHFPDKTIVCIEVEKVGVAEVMYSYPSGKSEFVEFRWHNRRGSRYVRCRAAKDGILYSGDADFQMAA